MRDKDASTGWTSQADALDEVRYYCQNWRADVSAIVTSGGYMVEWIKYSPYGIPFGLPGGDTDSDGDCDATDISQIQSWIDASSYDVRGDLDLDGGSSVDATDKSIAQSNYQGTTSGFNDLTAIGNRKGYAGYEWDGMVSMHHVRHRVLHPVLGRWTRRDPLGFVDGMNVYEYVGGRPVVRGDTLGLADGYIPGCPTIEPCNPDGSPIINDGWCYDDKGTGHCGLRCYRSYGNGTEGGQQCCYNDNGSLNTDVEWMGTIDIHGNSIGDNSQGICTLSKWRTAKHLWRDYFDYIMYGADAYNEIQCCMRRQGIPSGNPIPRWSPYYPDGVSDDDLYEAYDDCFVSVIFYDDTYCDKAK
ncbi:MAG: hypothetical protein HND57_08595 [Planctomycetes bacterium]|nr:hypothetical protein [Planctomycetota bacterium]